MYSIGSTRTHLSSQEFVGTCTPAILLLATSFYLLSTKQVHKGHQNDQNTPGVLKYFQLLPISFFTNYKLIAIEIVGNGQVIEETKTWISLLCWTRPVFALQHDFFFTRPGHDSCPRTRPVFAHQYSSYFPKSCNFPTFSSTLST